MTSNFFAALQNRAVYVNLAAATAALAAAFTAQYVFHLAPCELCLMQRMPYALVIALGVLYACGFRRDVVILGIMAPAFVVATGLAGFHVGVEQKWWEGFTACSAQLNANDFNALREQIINGPQARCDDIAWSFMGISMAGFNFVYALALSVFSFSAILKDLKREPR